MKTYQLERYGRLFFTTGAFKGPSGIFTTKILIDTGACYTLIPWEALEKIEKDYTIPRERVKLATANGYILAPIKRVEWFHSLGIRSKISLLQFTACLLGCLSKEFWAWTSSPEPKPLLILPKNKFTFPKYEIKQNQTKLPNLPITQLSNIIP